MKFEPALPSMLVFFTTFLPILSIGYLLIGRESEDSKRTYNRLRRLTGEIPNSPNPRGWISSLWFALPKLENLASSQKSTQAERLRERFFYAGYFKPNAPRIFRGIKLLLSLFLGCMGAVIALWFSRSNWMAVAFWELFGFATGMILPSYWLSSQIARRQKLLRHALPDALDMMVLCLEGGLSVTASVQRVTDELQVVHPILGMEMNVLQREMQLGLSTGEAFKKLGERCGLSDVRDLALVILQSEHYGASITKALRSFAETARHNHQQKMEEMAQRASVLILFPTLFCIFPAIFIVVIGPAVSQIARLFNR